MKPKITDAVSIRLDQYRRRVRLISWIGAGLVFEVTIYSIIISGDVRQSISAYYQILMVLVPSLILIAGGCLSIARAEFEWRADVYERNIESGIIQGNDSVETTELKTNISPEWPIRIRSRS